MESNSNFISFEMATKLVSQFGSPLYVYKKDQIQHNVKQVQQAARDFHVSYAMKANGNPEVLKAIKNGQNGVQNIDVVSPGEIYRALQCGFKPENILYTQNFISPEQLDYALEKGVMLNVGALETLQYFGSKLKGKSIFIRINPDMGAGENDHVITGGPESKFGISSKDFETVLSIANSHQIKIIGLHQHIGSNLKKKDKGIFVQTTKFIFEISKRFPDVKHINIGGGIGVKYRPTEQLMDIKELYQQIRNIRDSVNKYLNIWIQPGRFFIANAGALLCKITARKQTSARIYYGTDTGFNHLIRPNLYGAHHEIKNLSPCELPKQKVYVCGNVCESNDNLGVNIEISGRIGDILCIQNGGAYGYVMSSNYNQRPRPAEVMIQGDKLRLIRKRETFEDLKSHFV